MGGTTASSPASGTRSSTRTELTTASSAPSNVSSTRRRARSQDAGTFPRIGTRSHTSSRRVNDRSSCQRGHAQPTPALAPHSRCPLVRLARALGNPTHANTSYPWPCLDLKLAHELACFLREMFTVSRLSTVRRVCELSKIFMYADSVSWITLSYSFL